MSFTLSFTQSVASYLLVIPTPQVAHLLNLPLPLPPTHKSCLTFLLYCDTQVAYLLNYMLKFLRRKQELGNGLLGLLRSVFWFLFGGPLPFCCLSVCFCQSLSFFCQSSSLYAPLKRLFLFCSLCMMPNTVARSVTLVPVEANDERCLSKVMC